VKPEHEERFRRIAEDYLDRPGGDYAELLRRGEVSSPEDVDPEQWRAEIRAKARADKIRVMTIRSGDRAIAVRRLSIPKDQELAVLSAAMERGEAGYVDPRSGLFVLTAQFLADRGTCCERACRHCPYKV